MSLPGLAEALDALARCRKVIEYGALARQLGVPGPGSIAKLTEALEEMMREDARRGLPLRAALCSGRLESGMPAAGFFDLAARLGRYDGIDPVAFVTAEREQLFDPDLRRNLETGR